MSKMLEEMAGRIKRESKLKQEELTLSSTDYVLCAACSRPCDDHYHCPHSDDDDGALMMAKWAVKQVAEALNCEADGVTPKIWTDDKLQVALMNLIAEARKEDEAGCTI